MLGFGWWWWWWCSAAPRNGSMRVNECVRASCLVPKQTNRCLKRWRVRWARPEAMHARANYYKIDEYRVGS